jgi:hypothetical protein
MTEGWSTATIRLVDLMGRAVRGPKRDGVYALWLVVRAAEESASHPEVSPKLQQRQLEALHHRLASLTPPAPIRRAVASALSLLADGGADAPATALHQLAAPAKEALGPEVAEAVNGAVRAVRGTRE